MLANFNVILKLTFFHNTVLSYLITLLIVMAGLIVIRVVKEIVLIYLRELAKKTKSTLDDFLIESIQKNLVPILYFGAFYIALHNLFLSQVIQKGLDALGAVIITLFGIRFLVSLLTCTLEIFWLKRNQDLSKEKSLSGLLVIARTIIWGAGIVFLLDNLGFRISTVIAGLGIGGVAIALAAQAILGDLFSYVSILFDRPFEVGDFIIVGDKLGTVEHIGIKTTRVTSLSGEQLIFANSDLTKSRIQNYKRMEKRRVLFQIGIVYQTKKEQLAEIPKIIKSLIEGIKDATFDRAHFAAYGDSSLNFEIVYYVNSSDYNKYMDINQEINLKIFEEFAKRGIEFAYPTRTLFLNQ